MKKVVVILMVALAATLLLVWFSPSVGEKPDPDEPFITGNVPGPRRQLSVSLPSPDPTEPVTNSAGQGGGSWYESNRISRMEVMNYLAVHGTNSESLIAAHQLTGDRDFLKWAATNFPNDPLVQYNVAALNVFPEDRRLWLDRFKQSASNNAVAGYLSAADHLKSGNRELALKDFEEASNRRGFSDYSLEAMMQSEEILTGLGKPPVEAKWMSMAGTLLPALAQFKGLAQGMTELQKEYAASGDQGKANVLAEMTFRMGQRYSDDSGRFLIQNLVGYAIERIPLNQLDPHGTYDFLGGLTPTQRIDQLQIERTRVRELSKTIGSYFPDEAAPPSDPFWITYLDRLKTMGERSAMEWLERKRQAGQAPTMPVRDN